MKKRFTKQDLEKIRIVKTWNYEIGDDAYAKEQEILDTYADERYIGIDRLLSSGNTELFTRDVLELDKDYS